MIKRIFYFGYYLREIDRSKFLDFLEFTKHQTGHSSIRILMDILVSTFKYNISILDYFYFRFHSKLATERNQWAGTGYMYEFQMKMNPPAAREVLANKILFFKKLSAFAKRNFNTYDELIQNPSFVLNWLGNPHDKIVLKNSRGQVGAEVEIVKTSDFTSEQLLHYMLAHDFDMVEDFVKQHENLMKLSSTGLNTIRVITQIEKSQVIILAARLRISIDSSVDNLAAGNIAAPIDLTSGVVSGFGAYSDIRKQPQKIHPITKQSIVGFQIPYWKEALEIVRQAALTIPENRSVGWDVAITDTGPLLIEGNHNWCKLLWQLPVGQGLKEELERFVV
jgi:hypothetical protein